MRKKLLFGFLALVILLGSAVWYLNYLNRTRSPQGEANLEIAGLSINVYYSRPSVKGRQIFGEGEEALQPFGVYWRLGANESTEFEFSAPVTIWGNNLTKGRHKVYCYPGAKSFQFAFAPADGAWGYSEPNPDLEYFRIDVPVNQLEKSVDQFTITPRASSDGLGIDVHCDFDTYRLTLPFKTSP